jgi:hypothetical protein
MLHTLAPVLWEESPDPVQGEEVTQTIHRWRRQIDTDYADLSEAEKESDREWARKAFGVLVPYMQAHVLASTEAAHAAMVHMAHRMPPLMNVVHDQVMFEVPEGGDLEAAQAQLQMQMDQLFMGTSFELKGKRVDPKHVLLKEDGTYEVVEDRIVPWIPIEPPSKDLFYSEVMGLPFKVDNPCPYCGNQLELLSKHRPNDYICRVEGCTFDTRRPRQRRKAPGLFHGLPNTQQSPRSFLAGRAVGKTTSGRMSWDKPNMSNGPRSNPEKCLGCGHLLIEKPCIMCKAAKPNSVQLLARIPTARDRHAEEGEYPAYPYGPAHYKNGDPFEQDFDDWAADIVSLASDPVPASNELESETVQEEADRHTDMDS